MYWWNLAGLREQLARSAMSETQRFSYLLATLLLLQIAIAMPADAEQSNAWTLVDRLLPFVALTLGMGWAFRQNGGREGRRFLERVLSIGWVVSIRLIVLLVPFVVLLLVVAGLMDSELGTQDGPFASAVFLLIELIYYERIGHHIRLVAEAEQDGGLGLPGSAVEVAP